MTDTPISVQLYSLREEAAVDFPAVIRRLGEIGYVGVELAGLNGLTAAEFALIATESGLVVSSAHIGASPDTMTASLDELETIGTSTAILPFLAPEHFADRSAVEASAELVNQAAEAAVARGITFGYHNHWWELEQEVDGVPALLHMASLLEPHVIIELDTYWVTVGGHKAADIIAALGDRVRLLHVKDGPADDPKASMVAVGGGAMDVPSVIAAGAAVGVEWHVVELDRCDTDMMTAVADSYAYLTSNGLSRGRK